jgi:hypothetical protein
MKNESIRHLLFDCYLAINIWRIIFFAFHMNKRSSINHITGLGNSRKELHIKMKVIIRVVAMFWSI